MIVLNKLTIFSYVFNMTEEKYLETCGAKEEKNS